MSRYIVPWLAVCGSVLCGWTAAWAADWRHIEQGLEIPSEGYCDQPYVVITDEGHWLCVMTTGPGEEGDNRQHVVSTISTDRGRTWSPLVDIEPAEPPEASWALPLKTPGGRIYVFYVYNIDNLREVHGASGQVFKRVDTLGALMYRYSDDHGRSWSLERHRVPIRDFAIDRENVYEGRVQFFWGVGKPIAHDGAVYMGLSKVGAFGAGYLERTEGMFLKSDNILSERDPAKIRWETLPEGDIGLRAPEGPVAEEHNLVALDSGALYCTYRTTQGHPCHAYSEDGGASWTGPEYMTYTPGGRLVKHPRAANFVRKFRNGRYLYWFHNHAGRGYEGRNPVWMSGGIEIDGRMHWSEPEIVLYADDPKLRMSYPDFIEEQDGRIYVTETQKTVARVHLLDPDLLEKLWNQRDLSEVARAGLLLELTGAACAVGARHAMPPLPNPAEGGGFALEIAFEATEISPGQVLLDARDASGRGIAMLSAEDGAVRIVLNDGEREESWASDPGLAGTGARHHVTVIVDGGPKIITFVVDGRLCDGGPSRAQGWYRFDERLGDVGGAEEVSVAPGWSGRVDLVRLYGRYLTTTEAVGNYRAAR